MTDGGTFQSGLIRTSTHLTLDFPWRAPRLSPNKRMHWAKRAGIVSEVRNWTYYAVKQAKVPPSQHVTVELHYQPARKGRYDADNLVLDLKAACDGIPDAGVVADDIPALMTKRMPILHDPVKGEPGRLWLEIEITDTEATNA